MATNVLGILVNLTVRGREQVRGVNDDLRGLTGAADSAKATIGNFAIGLGAATAAIAGIGIAAKQAWAILQQGAAVDLTRKRFDNLTESIGVTSSALMGELRAATSGMMSDMELMSSASQIISLKLADTSDQVVRLSSVSGQLGWDMQQVILTFANMSTMRLDALGLSVEEVTSKAKELEAAGMSAQQAFKEAVIQAGEARLGTLGSEAETASGSLKQAAAAVQNLKNALLESTVVTLDQAGAFDDLSNAAVRLNLVQQITELDGALRAAGVQTDNLLARFLRTNNLSQMSTAALAEEVTRLEQSLAGVATIQAHQALVQRENTDAVLAAAVGYGTLSSAEADLAMLTQAVTAEVQSQTSAFATWGDAVAHAVGRAQAAAWGRQAASGAKGSLSYQYAEQYGGWNGTTGAITAADTAIQHYAGSAGYAISQEDALAAAHARMASAFNAEITARPEDGLINAEGLVNVTAMNDALYEQAQAAGASAVELAMLGIATGKFTKEQAAAALKAAVLQEQIRKVAEGVASGAIKYDAAVGYLEEFRQKLDASGGGAEGATANVEELVGMAKELTTGPYQADINANTTQAQADLQAVLDLIHGISGVHMAHVVVDTSGNGPEARALGGPVISGRPYWVGETGPELFVPGGSGYVVPNNALSNFQNGGSTLNINITNMVDGRPVGRTQLDDITTDTLMHALRAAGVA